MFRRSLFHSRPVLSAIIVPSVVCVTSLPTMAEVLVVGTSFGGGIVRYDMDAGTSNTVHGAASNKYLGNIAGDPKNNRVYWFVEWNNYLNRFEYDGDPEHFSGAMDDITGVFEFQDTSHAYNTSHLDVDPVADIAAIQSTNTQSPSTYFTRYTSIYTRNLTTGATTTVYEAPRWTITGWQGYYDPKPIWGKIHEIEDVVIDPVGKQIYWADSVSGTISRRNMDGSGSVMNLCTGLTNPTHLALDVGAGRIYFTQLDDANGHSISYAGINGGGITDIITGMAGYSVMDLDVDPLHGKVYWSDNNGGSSHVNRADYDGTNIEDVLNGSGGLIDSTLVTVFHGAGAVPENPLQGSPVTAGLLFDDTDLPQAGRTLFFETDYAEGFDFHVSSTQFASVLLPETGDGVYELYESIGGQYVFAQLLTGGELYTFSSGVNRFRILGVEQGDALNADDPAGFVTGLTFASDTTADLTISVVPEPAVLSLLGIGVLALLRRRES